MVPHVFVSSTVEDLAHLREAIRDTIESLGYRAVLSEHKGVGYAPPLSAVESCYEAVRDCQAAVVIIGKRYGQVPDSEIGISVSHAEFRQARDCGIPLFCLVDREVLTYKKVHDHGSGDVPAGFPEMEDAVRTFSFIDEVGRHPKNNAWLPYQGVTDACDTLKQQFAHYVGRFLRSTTDPVQSQITDVLAQVIALRADIQHSLPVTTDPRPYVRGATILVSDSYKQLRILMTAVSGGVEAAVRDLLKWATFTEYVESQTTVLESDQSHSSTTGDGETEAESRRVAGWFLTSEDFLSGSSRGGARPRAAVRGALHCVP